MSVLVCSSEIPVSMIVAVYSSTILRNIILKFLIIYAIKSQGTCARTRTEVSEIIVKLVVDKINFIESINCQELHVYSIKFW